MFSKVVKLYINDRDTRPRGRSRVVGFGGFRWSQTFYLSINMHRRKPASAKQRKAQIQLKRAVKRGDIPPPEPQRPDHVRKTKSAANRGRNIAVITASRRLQSSFIKLPPHFLEETKLLASTLTLHRPIAPEVAIFDEQSGGLRDKQFTLPKRPKWRYDMTKEDVEKREESFFKEWLSRTDALVEDWMNEGADLEKNSDATVESSRSTLRMPRSPTYFERNLDVWRQL
jgi:hypothetical protein